MNETNRHLDHAYWDAYRTLNNLSQLTFDLHMRMVSAGVPTNGVIVAQEALQNAAKAIRKEQLQFQAQVGEQLPVEVA